MLAKGAASLSDAELLAILLRTGPKGESILELTRRWLEETGGLPGLAALDLPELQRRRGIGPSKATIVAAALELGRRLAHAQAEKRDLLDRPELAAALLARRHAGERVEVFGCLTLDSRHRLVREHVLHRGARTHADVEPAEVFRVAIADNAHGVVVWHTHPSGDPTPSEDDLALTRQLAAAGKALGIRVLDHLVVAGGGHVSLRQRGLLPPA
jgi:DNA repair protein RadC